jgi:hypothetical protein
MMNAISLLWTSFAVSWVVLCALCLVTYFVWTRFYPAYTFKWQGPVLVATFFSFFSTHNTLLNIYQNGTIAGYQQAVAAAQQQAQGQQNLSPKERLLKDLEAVANSQGPVSKELKAQFETIYKDMFKSEKDKKAAYGDILAFYDCQKYFWEDALSAFNSQKTVKSDARKECETKAGGFFEREKLFTAEMVKNNDNTIALFASRKRIPASDGKEMEVNEKMLRQTLDAQSKAVANLQALLKE